MKYLGFFIGIALFSLSPFPAFAQIQITEIFYDREGSDNGYEWIEIYNSSEHDIDLASWYFRENDTNHGLRFEDSTVIPATEYAIIAQDRDMFRSEYSSQQLLIESTFSLNNTGENLAILNPEKMIIDEYFYQSDRGAQGDGNSLQLVSGTWRALSPSPGTPYTSSEQHSNEHDQENDSSSDENTDDVSTSDRIDDRTKQEQEAFQKYYDPYLVFPETMIAGAPIRIQAGTYYVEEYRKTRKLKGSYYLNFGDGTSLSSQERIDTLKSYQHPGSYIITFEYYRNKWPDGKTRDPDVFYQKKIKVMPDDVAISGFTLDGSLLIQNNSGVDIDIGAWSIHHQDGSYVFPRYSYLARDRTITLSREVLNTFVYKGNISDFSLHNQQGVLIHRPWNETSLSQPSKDQSSLPLSNTETKDTEGLSEHDIHAGEQVLVVDHLEDMQNEVLVPEAGQEQIATDNEERSPSINTIVSDSKQPFYDNFLVWIGVILVVMGSLSLVLLRYLRKPIRSDENPIEGDIEDF